MFTNKMNLSGVLRDFIHIQDAARVSADMFGVEVELEGKNIANPTAEVLQYWTPHNDASLRKLSPGDEAIEYVFSAPYNLDITDKALNTLCTFLTRPGCKVYESYRTSIHVHVNFGRETFKTIYNFMTLSLLLDELLVSQNGEHRIGNNFCLRSKDAIGQLIAITNSIENGKEFFNFQEHERYSSINFASLMKFGTIEFRSLECTVHHGRIMQWIGTLQQMKVKARTFKDPTDIIRLYSVMGPTEFLNHILGPYAFKYQKVPDFENMLHNGMRLAQDLAFSSNWTDRNVVDKTKELSLAAAKFAKYQFGGPE